MLAFYPWILLFVLSNILANGGFFLVLTRRPSHFGGSGARPTRPERPRPWSMASPCTPPGAPVGGFGASRTSDMAVVVKTVLGSHFGWDW